MLSSLIITTFVSNWQAEGRDEEGLGTVPEAGQVIKKVPGKTQGP